MNVPHPQRFFRGLRTFRQLRKSWYMAFFQLPWLPEWALGRHDAEAVGKAFTDSAVDADRFDDAAVRPYRTAASEPGALRATAELVRAIPLGMRDVRRQRDVVISTPTLMVWGEQDVALGRELAEGTEEFVADLTLRFLPDASHWVQQDQPDTVNSMLTAFLRGDPVPEHDVA